jgi:hypothetical protein
MGYTPLSFVMKPQTVVRTHHLACQASHPMFFQSPLLGSMTKKYVAFSSSTGNSSVGHLTQGSTNAVEARIAVTHSQQWGCRQSYCPRQILEENWAVKQIVAETEWLPTPLGGIVVSSCCENFANMSDQAATVNTESMLPLLDDDAMLSPLDQWSIIAQSCQNVISKGRRNENWDGT